MSQLPTTNYLDVLLHRWRVVFAMPLLAALVAAGVSLATPPTYEATAIIALAPATLSVPITTQAPPYYLLVDSPRQLPTAFSPTFYVALLKSPEVEQAVKPQTSATIASNSSDRSIIEITARGRDPKEVAETANRWATVGVQAIQKALLPTGEQTTLAQKNLDAAEQALARFSQENGLGEYDLAKLRAPTTLSAAKKAELAQLLRDRDIAETVLLDFQREQTRARILATTSFKPATVTATVPTAPVSPRPMQSILIGAGLGVLVGIVAAFALEYLRK